MKIGFIGLGKMGMNMVQRLRNGNHDIVAYARTAETVKKARSLDDCHFWVLEPGDNTKLWNNHEEDVEDELRNILTDTGQRKFRKLQLEDFVNRVENAGLSAAQQKWLASFREKYLFPRTAE